MDHDTLVSLAPVAVLSLLGFARARYQPDSEFFSHQRWRYGEVVLTFALAAASHWVLALSALSHTDSVGAWITRYAFVALVSIAAVWSIVRSHHKHPWHVLGFDSTTWVYHGLWSVRLAAGIMCVLTAVVLLTDPRTTEPVRSPPSASHVEGSGGGDFAAAFAVATFVVPVAEELRFRGLAYGPLLRKFGATGATIVTASLWAFAHYSEPSWESVRSVSWTFLVGVFYGELYRRRKSLVPTVTLHVAHNAVATFASSAHGNVFGLLFGISVTLLLGIAVLLRADVFRR